MQSGGIVDTAQAAAVLRSVAEQLKLPLVAVARQAELGQLVGHASGADLHNMQAQAQAALTLVDSYLLGLQLLQDQQALPLEPVSLSSLLVETAHEMTGYARQYDVRLELHIAGKYQPVMGHRRALKAALLSLAYALLESVPPTRKQLTLAVHRTPQGIVTGMYGSFAGLNAEGWRRALRVQAVAAQPVKALAGSSAGLFVADTILQAMDTRLRVGKHQHMQGLATTLQASQQLSLV